MPQATIDEKRDELGSEVLRCCPRRRSSVHVDLVGFTGYMQLILLPPLIAFFVTGGVILVVAKVFDPQGQNIPLAAGLTGLFTTITVALYIYFFSTPETPCLVLHENGFRCKRRRVLFSNLLGISIGQDPSTLGQIAQGLGSLMSWHPAARVAENSARASVSLILDDKSTISLKNILLENKFEDLERFFDIVQRDHPQVQVLS